MRLAPQGMRLGQRSMVALSVLQSFQRRLGTLLWHLDPAGLTLDRARQQSLVAIHGIHCSLSLSNHGLHDIVKGLDGFPWALSP